MQVAAHESIRQASMASTSYTPQDLSPSASHTLQEDSPEEEEILIPTSFDFALIDPFAKSVKEAIGWEEEKEAPRKLRKYFPNLKKDPETFPFIEELEELIKDEWQKPDKKNQSEQQDSKTLPIKGTNGEPSNFSSCSRFPTNAFGATCNSPDRGCRYL